MAASPLGLPVSSPQTGNTMRFTSLLIFLLLVSIPLCAQNDNAGRKAPNFKIEDINGNMVELEKEIGSGPVIINFWATWCIPCREELPKLHDIYKDLKDQGLKLFAISIDDERTSSKVEPFVKQKGFTFPVLLDPGSSVRQKYYATDVPFTLILDKAGNIAYSHQSYKKGDELKIREIVESLLK